VTRVLAIVGPTATGKSDLAVALARRLDGEIVNADSMQLYAGMDIGTAKLPENERGGVPHHLLDVWPIAKSAAVAEYQAMARATITEIAERGHLPVLVGGSGLYLRGALDRLDFPGESPEIRARLYGELDQVGPGVVHARLAALDPAAAGAILASNGRRIVRALEVIELTGRPFTATMPGFESVYDTVFVGLDRVDLDERVERRVHAMMALGFLNEVCGLLPSGLRDSPTAGKALGYAQLLGALGDTGELTGDLDDAVATTIRATKRFVRRQRSWFRRDPRVHWLDPAAPDTAERVLALTLE
jgi:tRNA dimethylallyltransferase